MTEDPTMTCPVCDSKVPEEKDECPVCGVSLIPFKEGFEGDIDESSMEKVIDIISDEDEELFEDLDIDDLNLGENEDTGDEDLAEGEEKELIDDIKDLGLTEDQISKEEEPKESVTFECPVCESEVSEDASECPNCEAVFEEKSEDEAVEDDLPDTSEIDGDFEEWEDDISLDVEEDFEDFEDLDDIGEEEISIDLESHIESFNEDIEELKERRVDVEEIKADIDELEEFYEPGEEGKGKELVDETEDKIAYAQEIAKKLKRCEHYIDWLSGKTDISKLEGWVDDIRKGCEIGEYRIARKKAKEAEEDIKDMAQSHGLEKGERLEEEIEEEKKKIKDEISQLGDLDLDLGTTPIEENIDNAAVEKDEGNLTEAFHKVMEAKKDVEELYRFTEIIVEGKSKVERLKQQGEDHQKFSKKIEEAKEEAKKGNFARANELLEETIDKVEKSLEEEKKETEEGKKEKPLKEKKEDLFKKIQEKIPEMRSLLGTAKEFGVEIEGGEDLINEAVEQTKQNEYEKAIESLNDCGDFFKKKLDKKIDLEINNIEKNSTEEVQSIIDDIKKYREEGSYEKVSELIEKGKEKTTEKKESEESVEQKISETQDILDKGEDIDLKFPKARQLLEQAKKKCEEDNTVKAQEMIDKAQDKAFQRLKDILKKEIKNARDELKQAKIKGANISKPVELLKETNSAQKNDNLEKSLDKFKKFKDEMEEIREGL